MGKSESTRRFLGVAMFLMLGSFQSGKGLIYGHHDQVMLIIDWLKRFTWQKAKHDTAQSPPRTAYLFFFDFVKASGAGATRLSLFSEYCT